MPPFQEDTKDGLGLNPYAGDTNTYTTKYYGANRIRAEIQFAPNADRAPQQAVLRAKATASRACPSRRPTSPASASTTSPPASSRSGAAVVFALGWQPGENLVNALFDPDAQDDGRHLHDRASAPTGTAPYKPYFGWIGWKPDLYFDSVRTPGARSHLDPDPDEGFLRGVTGDLEMTNDQWLGDTSTRRHRAARSSPT